MDASAYTLIGLKEILEENNIEIPKGTYLKSDLVKLYEEEVLKKKKKKPSTRSSRLLRSNNDDRMELIPLTAAACGSNSNTGNSSSNLIISDSVASMQSIGKQHQVIISTSSMDITLSSEKPICCSVSVDGITYAIKPRETKVDTITQQSELLNNTNLINQNDQNNNNLINNNLNNSNIPTRNTKLNNTNNTNTIKVKEETFPDPKPRTKLDIHNNSKPTNACKSIKSNDSNNPQMKPKIESTITTTIKQENSPQKSKPTITNEYKKTKTKSYVKNRIIKPVNLKKLIIKKKLKRALLRDDLE